MPEWNDHGWGRGRVGGRNRHDDSWERPREQYEQFTTRDNWSQTKLAPFTKNFYDEHIVTKRRTDDQVEEIRAENRITIRSGKDRCPKPVKTLQEVYTFFSICDFLNNILFEFHIDFFGVVCKHGEIILVISNKRTRTQH